MPRCAITVLDPLYNQKRKCRNSKKYGDFCWCHAKIYGRYVIKIQNAWKGYSAKRRFNLFKNLPDDAWSIVLNFIVKTDTIKLLKSYDKVYANRLDCIYAEYTKRTVEHMAHSGAYYIDYQDNLKICEYVKKREHIWSLINQY